MRSWPRSRINELGIEWDKRHREWILARIAEMYKPKEITQMALTEYAIEWALGDPNNPAHRERFETIRAFVFDKVKSYAYKGRSKKLTNRIEELRREFKKNLQEHYREANKFARVRDLNTIKEMAMKDKQFMAAVKALEAIRVEIEGLGPGPSVTVNNNTQVNIRNAPTASEIDRELERLLADAGVDRSTATAFLTGIGESPSAPSHLPEKVPAPMEGRAVDVPGATPRVAEGNDLLELPPGIQPA